MKLHFNDALHLRTTNMGDKHCTSPYAPSAANAHLFTKIPRNARECLQPFTIFSSLDLRANRLLDIVERRKHAN